MVSCSSKSIFKLQFLFCAFMMKGALSPKNFQSYTPEKHWELSLKWEHSKSVVLLLHCISNYERWLCSLRFWEMQAWKVCSILVCHASFSACFSLSPSFFFLAFCIAPFRSFSLLLSPAICLSLSFKRSTFLGLVFRTP